MNKNSNTMKNGRDPETQDVNDELRKIDPLEIKLKVKKYGKVPDVPKGSD